MKSLLRTIAALLGPLTVLLLAAAPVGAHGGEGEVEITSITREGDDVTVTARLRYLADGHGVPDATVTVVVGDATPVPMEPAAEEGDYQATVAAPAGAAIRVTSVEPAATAEGTAPAPTDPPTTAEGTTTAPETTTTAAPTDDEAAAPAPAPSPTPVPDDDGSDDGGISPIVIGAIVAVVLAAAVMAAILLGKRPAADDPGSDA